MCVTICGRFCTDESIVVGYDNQIWAKDTANSSVQIAGMIFQTRSSVEAQKNRQKCFTNTFACLNDIIIIILFF
ncbi:DUF6783 domain-containing protein [Anthropogastromicrobium sp.]|uniref:DUF6783 domain-containing protein n=1 Tax=Anthropogastromicrobium sp. TaxID=2981649 RepID=UPI003078D438